MALSQACLVLPSILAHRSNLHPSTLAMVSLAASWLEETRSGSRRRNNILRRRSRWDLSNRCPRALRVFPSHLRTLMPNSLLTSKLTLRGLSQTAWDLSRRRVRHRRARVGVVWAVLRTPSALPPRKSTLRSPIRETRSRLRSATRRRITRAWAVLEHHRSATRSAIWRLTLWRLTTRKQEATGTLSSIPKYSVSSTSTWFIPSPTRASCAV